MHRLGNILGINEGYVVNEGALLHLLQKLEVIYLMRLHKDGLMMKYMNPTLDRVYAYFC